MRRITSTTLGIALLLLATHSITNPYVIQVFHLITPHLKERFNTACLKKNNRPIAVTVFSLTLTMLPICLRHAPNNLTEDEHPVHLVFLDRVPR